MAFCSNFIQAARFVRFRIIGNLNNDTMPYFLQWIEDYTRFLINNANDPNEAFFFAESMISSLKQHGRNETSETFNALFLQLRSISFLSKDLDFRISFDENSNLSTQKIARALLDRNTALEALRNAIFCDLKLYCNFEKLDIDIVLFEYATELLSDCAKNPELQPFTLCRVVTIFKNIARSDLLITLLSIILQQLTFPVSIEMEEIVAVAESRLKSNHTSSENELSEQIRLFRLKQMLFSYGITNFNASDLKIAGGMIMFTRIYSNFSGTSFHIAKS